MRELLPPKNVRKTTPRCCVTCKHYIEVKDGSDTYPECERDEDIVSTSEEDYFRVCDYWRLEKPC